MTVGDLACKSINEGNASRYIKPRWLNGGKLLTEAFDLREGSPPETYVSHFIAEGNSRDEQFRSAYRNISQRIKRCEVGHIAILNIMEALTEVNDDVDPFIQFIEKGLPHCGLIYLTSSQQQIQEAKATLCLLAERALELAQVIAVQIESTKQVECNTKT